MRPLRRTLIAVVAAAVGIALVPQSGQAAPKPTLAQVKAELDALNNQAEVASEKWNKTQLDMVTAEQNVSIARVRVDASKARLAAAQAQVGQFASALYRGGNLDPSVQLFLADNPTQYLQQVSALAGVATRETNILSMAATAKLRLDSDQLAVTQQLAAVQALDNAAAADYAQIIAAQASETSLLNSLQAAQRAALLKAQAEARAAAVAAARLALLQAQQAAARAVAAQATQAAAARAAAAAAHRRPVGASHPPRTHHTPAPAPSPSPPPGSGGGGGAGSIGARVVAYALARVGDAYVWGGSGPYAYDCSGLTMRAYQSVGISLPHYAQSQYNDGRRISVADLLPGDLVFYYSDIHHVGIYIGGGMIVNAENPGVGVTITGLFTMPYMGAVRPY
jgi:cell wall-associated NlpC family hydrolase